MRCLTPARNASAGAAAVDERVYLALNGQQYHAADPTFSFTPVAQLASVAPASGPFLGATRLEVRGVGLRGGDRYRCRFEWSDEGGGTANATVVGTAQVFHQDKKSSHNRHGVHLADDP